MCSFNFISDSYVFSFDIYSSFYSNSKSAYAYDSTLFFNCWIWIYFSCNTTFIVPISYLFYPNFYFIFVISWSFTIIACSNSSIFYMKNWPPLNPDELDLTKFLTPGDSISFFIKSSCVSIYYFICTWCFSYIFVIKYSTFSFFNIIWNNILHIVRKFYQVYTYIVSSS